MPTDRIFKDGWLQAYRDYIVKQESPDIFHMWVGLTVLASTLRRNVWMDRGAYQLLPNMYVFLIARSGVCRKSVAMEIGVDLLSALEAKINIVRGRMSLEGLMDQMCRVAITPEDKIVPDGSVMIQSDELSYLFGKASYITDLLTFLTAAYTGKASLDFLTRNKGLCKVRNPCPCVLSACTPEQLGEVFPSMSLVSGFMGRVILVYGEQTSRIAKPELREEMKEDLILDLNTISELYGEIKMTPECETAFDRWYEALPLQVPSELSSFYERKHDHVLKVAMLLSVSKSSNLIVDLEILQQAIALVELIEESLPRAVAYIGATQQAYVGDLIYGFVASSDEPVSHSVLLRRFYKKLNQGAGEFAQIIDSLKEAGRIKEVVTDKGIFYKADRRRRGRL